MNHTMRKRMKSVVIILFWLAIWQIAAVCIDNHILLVGPGQVLRAFAHNVIQPDFVKIVMHSFVRIGLGFFLALFAGLLLGAVSYRFTIVEEILAPAVQAVKSIPVASFVVLLLIWFGSRKLSFFISFLIVLPNVYVNMIAGLKSADVKLLQMAQVFGIGRGKRFFYLYRPAVMPYLVSSLKISLGMSWKSGVAAEVIGLPDYSMGERLYLSKIYLDTAGLFSWTLTIILVSFLFEKTVLWLVQIFADWKPYPKVYAKRRNVSKKDVVTDTIRVQKVYKSYSLVPVLHNLNMSMEKGKRYLLMAPSGGGKTTLLKLLTGLEHADSGAISGMPEHIGMVFQEDRLCEEYDAVCNIMLGMKGTGIENIIEYVRQEAEKILPQECLTKPVRELSGGMRRRVSLLRAVLSASDILILDEPFTGLDEENRLHCTEYLLENLGGRTLLVTTHREDDVELLRGIKITL